MNIFISGEQLECGLMCAADKDVRYYLNSVYVECSPHITRVVATNGHYIFVMDSKPCEVNEWSGSFILPRDVLERIKPKGVVSKRKAEYCITVEPRESDRPDHAQPPLLKIREIGDSHAVECTAMDGRYPDYARIIPVGNALAAQVESSALFNIEYLMLALKLYRKLHSAKAVTVPLKQYRDQYGVVMLRENATFIVMPVRADSVKYHSLHGLDDLKVAISALEQREPRDLSAAHAECD